MTSEQLEQLKRFESLPDDCIVRDPVAALLLDTSVWTLRRNNPVPKIQISARCYGRRAGDLRRKIRGETNPA
ncbi:MAG TPA: hypothetical protein VJ255_21635 [Candidatus Acidoferrum sp.]|jgi:hypothetical protein|nr:hypothetical protein [Candidatus Acidoferrum sp.]